MRMPKYFANIERMLQGLLNWSLYFRKIWIYLNNFTLHSIANLTCKNTQCYIMKQYGVRSTRLSSSIVYALEYVSYMDIRIRIHYKTYRRIPASHMRRYLICKHKICYETLRQDLHLILKDKAKLFRHSLLGICYIWGDFIRNIL